MLVDEVGVEDAGAGVEGWRRRDYYVLALLVLQHQAQQTHLLLYTLSKAKYPIPSLLPVLLAVLPSHQV